MLTRIYARNITYTYAYVHRHVHIESRPLNITLLLLFCFCCCCYQPRSGTCNKATGLCACQSGFEGSMCEFLSCPAPGGKTCSGNGACTLMTDLAALATVNGEAVPQTYGNDPFVAATWDANHVYGCACESGWTGYDCR